ncbi:MAG: AbrB/MazE/SpoVT family DNA-binding domain-containing protein [Candidatus Sabulitectum sp.]|nr:AbrB/MazE/SpoVT family DNA-binding domain-containing protein [Candidatus Sabulitectum sp.]
MQTIIKKWGNSLAVRIPKAIAEDLRIENNSKVELYTENNCLVVKSIEIEYSLTELLSKVTEENLHKEIDTGRSAGREEL